jgi:basic amino acid/polyamine antiporter, APA family
MSGPRMFTRNATGLVRAASGLDTIAYNLFFGNPWLAMVFVFLFVPPFIPGANLVLATLFCFVLVLPFIVSYALLAAAIPRSGGEYTYISRIIHPAVAMMANFNVTFFGIVFVGTAGSWFAQWGVAQFLRIAGAYTGSRALVDAAAAVASPEGRFFVGALLIVLFTLVFVRGLRAYFTLQRIAFVLGSIGLVIGALVLAAADPAAFPAAFNAYAQPLTGNPDTYKAVTDAAAAAGYAPVAANAADSFRAVDWVFLALGYCYASAYIGGEVRRPARNQLVGMLSALVITSVVLIVYFILMDRVVGQNFLGAVGTSAVDAGLPDTPTFVELIAATSSSALVWLPLAFCFIFWTFSTMPVNILTSTRNLLAYAVDGLAPRQFAEVGERSHAPVFSLVFVGVLGIVWLWVYIFTSYTSVILLIFANVLTYLTTALAAALLPSRRPQLFESSPVNHRVGGVPSIAIIGALGVVTMAIMLFVILNDPISGFSVGDPFNLVFNLVVYFFGAIYYFLARAVQKARGVNVDRSFAEIPVE